MTTGVSLVGDDAGTPIIKSLETPTQASNLLLIGLLLFAIVLLILIVVLLVLKKKFIKDRKDYIKLP